MYIEELAWQHYQNLPHISRLPLNEQIRLYNMYLMEVAEMKIAYLHHEMANPQNLGGGTDEIIDEFPGGGSGAVTFNGTNQYFQAPNAQVTNWLPGNGDFTIEMFVKNGNQTVGAPRIFSLGFDTGATIGISYEGGSIYVWPYGSDLVGSTPASFNNKSAWMHIAICRSGTTTKLFLNGTLKATKTGDTRNINDSINPGYDLNVGVDNPSAGSPNWFAGKLTNFRWDNSAIYTGSSLIVPTSPLTKTATTKLLMLGGGSTNPVYDAAKLNILVNHGSVWDSETPFV
jgi:hypothetical protein